MEFFEWSYLGTYAGAMLATAVLTQLTKELKGISRIPTQLWSYVLALVTLLLTSLLTPMLPYILAFAAGAMIYVVVEELIPESQAGAHSNVGTIGTALGFALMMLLDVALG